MQPVVFPDGEGVAGEFPAIKKHVVASGAYSFQPEMFECVLKHGELSPRIVQLMGCHKCEVQVPKVVVDRPPARGAAHQMSAVLQQLLHMAFRVWVLMPADNYGPPVPPQVHHHCV